VAPGKPGDHAYGSCFQWRLPASSRYVTDVSEFFRDCGRSRPICAAPAAGLGCLTQRGEDRVTPTSLSGCRDRMQAYTGWRLSSDTKCCVVWHEGQSCHQDACEACRAVVKGYPLHKHLQRSRDQKSGLTLWSKERSDHFPMGRRFKPHRPWNAITIGIQLGTGWRDNIKRFWLNQYFQLYLAFQCGKIY
jgi:hypothetical protein